MIWVSSVLFGVLEVFTALYIAFSLFRIPLRSYLIETTVCAIFLGCAATVALNLFQISFFIYGSFEAVALILFFVFAIKLPLTFAGLVALTGYIVNSLVIAIIGESFIQLNVVTIDELLYYPPATILVQTIGIAVNIAFFSYLYVSGFGFSYLSDRFEFKSELAGVNMQIIGTTVLGFICIFLSFHLAITNHKQVFLFVTSQIFIVATIMWLWYLRVNKEHEKHYKNFPF